MLEQYQPRPVPKEASEELRTFLEDELAAIALLLAHLLQYNEDNP